MDKEDMGVVLQVNSFAHLQHRQSRPPKLALECPIARGTKLIRDKINALRSSRFHFEMTLSKIQGVHN